MCVCDTIPKSWEDKPWFSRDDWKSFANDKLRLAKDLRSHKVEKVACQRLHGFRLFGMFETAWNAPTMAAIAAIACLLSQASQLVESRVHQMHNCITTKQLSASLVPFICRCCQCAKTVPVKVLQWSSMIILYVSQVLSCFGKLYSHVGYMSGAKVFRSFADTVPRSQDPTAMDFRKRLTRLLSSTQTFELFLRIKHFCLLMYNVSNVRDAQLFKLILWFICAQDILSILLYSIYTKNYKFSTPKKTLRMSPVFARVIHQEPHHERPPATSTRKMHLWSRGKFRARQNVLAPGVDECFLMGRCWKRGSFALPKLSQCDEKFWRHCLTIYKLF